MALRQSIRARCPRLVTRLHINASLLSHRWETSTSSVLLSLFSVWQCHGGWRRTVNGGLIDANQCKGYHRLLVVIIYFSRSIQMKHQCNVHDRSMFTSVSLLLVCDDPPRMFLPVCVEKEKKTSAQFLTTERPESSLPTRLSGDTQPTNLPYLRNVFIAN